MSATTTPPTSTTQSVQSDQNQSLDAALADGLNAGQRKAAEGFFQFLFSDEREFVIEGPGGVGKTHLLGHLVDRVLPLYRESCQILGLDPIYNHVSMTATTNKAAEVLGLAVGRQTSTIHSFLGLKVQDDYSRGTRKLEKTGRWQVHEGIILCVDEAGLIDHNMRELIKEGTHKSKIIYVGDDCQLPPVMDNNVSPVFRDGLPSFELTEPERTQNPELLAINKQLRETVKTGVFKPIRTVPGTIDLLSNDSMKREIERYFKKPNTRDRILAYTNNRVIAYNNWIRKIRQLPDHLTVGETVVNNTAIEVARNKRMAVEEEFEVIYVADDTFTIKITPDVELEVREIGVRGRYYTFQHLTVPVDQHYFGELVKYFRRIKNWSVYFHLINTFPDLRPRDAATVHKAQGSSYDTVFIDLKDLSTCRNPFLAARLLYVAFSRARERVVLYGDLNPKFGGIIGDAR